MLTGVAVEVREPKGMGRCRIAPLADASSDSLHRFVTDHVEPGATVIADGWQGYSGVDKLGYVHDRRSQRAARSRGRAPTRFCRRCIKSTHWAKRWLLGTHQGSAEQTHLASYLNEFVFRFNRHRSQSRGMVFFRVLELAVAHAPCATSTSSPSGDRATFRRGRCGRADTRQVWSGLQRIGRGEPLRRITPVKWIPQFRL